jgi:geranylgeranylglycerol-phosphate geranylgeranyltransferase
MIVAVLIGAGGYVINGHYDRKIDAVNHPDYKFPFTKKQTYGICLFLFGGAISLGLSVFSINFTLGFILLPIVALWLYSAFFKKLPVLGNITVAFVSLWLPVGLLFLNHCLDTLQNESVASQMTLALLSEVFLITLARELIKDIQDVTGDRSENANTLPIWLGEKVARGIGSGIILMGMLIWYNILSKEISQLSIPSTLLGIVTLVILFASIGLLWRNEKWIENAKLSSLSIKIGMFTALLTAIFI